ncbi:980_t:CDS:1, partial [Gigaspora rosea]
AEIRSLIEQYKIDGGGLKNYSKTRWTTANDTVESVIHLEKVLKK